MSLGHLVFFKHCTTFPVFCCPSSNFFVNISCMKWEIFFQKTIKPFIFNIFNICYVLFTFFFKLNMNKLQSNSTFLEIILVLLFSFKLLVVMKKPHECYCYVCINPHKLRLCSLPECCVLTQWIGFSHLSAPLDQSDVRTATVQGCLQCRPQSRSTDVKSWISSSFLLWRFIPLSLLTEVRGPPLNSRFAHHWPYITNN